jgi:predicted O-methyltransferase YrrM
VSERRPCWGSGPEMTRDPDSGGSKGIDDMETLIESLYSADGATGKTGKKFNELSGLSTRRNLKTIEQLMIQQSPRNTLEVGMAFGASTAVFAAMHRSRNPTTPHAHVAIDPFQSTAWDSVGRLKLEQAHLSDYVEVIEDRSSIVLPRLMAEGRQFGLIYVDGSHLFEDVFIDAYYSMRLLETGGYLLFDDSADPHVAKVLAFIHASVPCLERQAAETTFKQKMARYLGKRQLTVYRRTGAVDREWNARFERF